MQLSAIRTEVYETAGVASDDPRIPTATMTRIVNRALRRVSGEYDWPWLQTTETITTAAGTQAYTPTSGYRKTLRLRYEDQDLVELQPRDAAQYHNVTGSPVGFFTEDDKVHVVPTPDGVYSLHHVYQARETALSSDSDTPLLPDEYIDWLVFTALILVAARIRDDGLYGIADRERRRAADDAMRGLRRSTQSAVPKSRIDWAV